MKLIVQLEQRNIVRIFRWPTSMSPFNFGFISIRNDNRYVGGGSDTISTVPSSVYDLPNFIFE